MGRSSKARRLKREREEAGVVELQSKKPKVEEAGVVELQSKKPKVEYAEGKVAETEDEQVAESAESDSEDEDEEGELLTEELDRKIAQVVDAVRRNDPVVKDPRVRLFDDAEDAAAEREKKARPVYLRDYHRMNLLDELGDEELPYSERLEQDRAALVREMHAAAESGSDDEFVTRAKTEREVEAVELPDPAADPDSFLETFMASKAWRPSAPVKPRRPEKHDIVDDDDDEFDKAEEFETKYNFRFEAGEEATQVVSYGREVVNAHSVRREDETARQRARRLRREEKEQQKKAEAGEVKKYKQEKVKSVMSKLDKIRKVAGLDETDELDIDLDSDFDADDWDAKMAKVFGDKFYNKPEKVDDDEIESLSKRQKKKKHEARKKEEKELKKAVEEFVETEVLPLDENLVKSPETKFRYREVSPDSFSLEPVDILLADDAQLNEYVGLKKLAPYRPPDKKMKDHKRYAKKKRLREWRKEVFGTPAKPEWKDVLHN